MSNNILLVCTDTLESQLLVMALERVGLAVTVVADLDGKRPSPPDLIVLVNHDGHYLATARRLRQEFSAPLLLLTDFHREEEHISALQEGVDLIFFRPYSIRFLAVQIPALLWRLMPPAPSVPMENGPDILSGPFSARFPATSISIQPHRRCMFAIDRQYAYPSSNFDCSTSCCSTRNRYSTRKRSSSGFGDIAVKGIASSSGRLFVVYGPS